MTKVIEFPEGKLSALEAINLKDIEAIIGILEENAKAVHKIADLILKIQARIERLERLEQQTRQNNSRNLHGE